MVYACHDKWEILYKKNSEINKCKIKEGKRTTDKELDELVEFD